MAPRSIVQVQCAPGTLKDPITSNNRLSGFDVDLSLSENSYKCTGKRFNNSPNPEDPLKFQPQLFYSGYLLPTCSCKCFSVNKLILKSLIIYLFIFIFMYKQNYHRCYYLKEIG